MKTCSTIPDILLIPVPSKSANVSSHLLTAGHSVPSHSWTLRDQTWPHPTLSFLHLPLCLLKFPFGDKQIPLHPLNLVCSEESLYISLSQLKPRSHQKTPSSLKLPHMKVIVSPPSSRAQKQVTSELQTIIPASLKMPCFELHPRVPPSLPRSHTHRRSNNLPTGLLASTPASF